MLEIKRNRYNIPIILGSENHYEKPEQIEIYYRGFYYNIRRSKCINFNYKIFGIFLKFPLDQKTKTYVASKKR
jgi:hypothetical protein